MQQQMFRTEVRKMAAQQAPVFTINNGQPIIFQQLDAGSAENGNDQRNCGDNCWNQPIAGNLQKLCRPTWRPALSNVV